LTSRAEDRSIGEKKTCHDASSFKPKIQHGLAREYNRTSPAMSAPLAIELLALLTRTGVISILDLGLKDWLDKTIFSGFSSNISDIL
jgi:hypothetical protein